MERINNEYDIFPKNWCEVDIKSVALKITDGSHNPPKKQASGFPMLSARNIQNNKINFDNIRYIDEISFKKEYARANVEEGDVLLTIVGTIGRSAIVKERIQKFTLQRSVALIKPCLVDSQFLSYSFQEPCFQRNLFKNAKGTAQKGIYLKTLSSLKICLAPLAEQRRIVAKIEELFSELDKGIESLKTAQQQLKIYRQAVLKWSFEGKLTAEWREQQQKAGTLESAETLLENIKIEREKRYQQQLEEWKEKVKVWEDNGKEGKKPSKPRKSKETPPLSDTGIDNSTKLPVGWKWTYLQQLSKDITDGDHQAPPKADNGIPFIVISNIKNNKVDFSTTKFVPIQYFQTLKENRVPKKGDILYTVTGSFGIPSLIDYDKKFCFQRHIALIRLENFINKRFIFYLLQSGIVDIQARKVATGTAQKTVPLSGLRSFSIPLCTQKEQDQIVQEIESRFSICDQLEATIKDNLEKSEALRQSILKRAMTGKLVPQDPNDEPAELLLERIKQEKAGLKNQVKQLKLETC